MGEWIFAQPDSPIIQDTYRQVLFPALSPDTALQREWKTPTEFPLCPIQISETPLTSYIDNLCVGKVITRNQYTTQIIDDFALCNENLIMVICHSLSEDIKKYTSVSITLRMVNISMKGVHILKNVEHKRLSQ